MHEYGDDRDPSQDALHLFEEQISRRQLLRTGGALLGAAAAGPLIFTTADAAPPLKSNLPYNANLSVKGDIEFWHFWASPLRRGTVHQIISLFNHYYKGVHVHDLPLPFGDIWTKNDAAVASGSGMPDVIVSDRPSLWNESRHHVYEPLGKLTAKDHILGKYFWPFTWREAVVKGQPYGLPYETDCRVLFYNREQFVDAGLGSNKAPTTWADLKAYADKLDKKGGSGYDTVAFYPLWGPGLDSWVWTNRGSWQNKKMYPTVNAKQNIQTGDWLKSWTDRYGLSTLNGLRATAVPGHDLFESGKAAMWVDIPGYQAQLNFYNPNFKTSKGQQLFPQWGVGLIPHNTGGKPYSFSGGFSLSMPLSRHRSAARTAAAWEFMKFMALVGQRFWAERTNAIPTVPSIALHDTSLSTQPHWNTFMQAMKYGHPKDRNTWDADFPSDVVGPAQDAIQSGKKSARDALDAAQQQALVNMKKNGGP